MANQTLEQKARTSTTSNVVIAQCGYCYKELKIPKEIEDKISELRLKFADEQCLSPLLDKQHNGFYVSLGGFYYCNPDCSTRFTED